MPRRHARRRHLARGGHVRDHTRAAARDRALRRLRALCVRDDLGGHRAGRAPRHLRWLSGRSEILSMQGAPWRLPPARDARVALRASASQITTASFAVTTRGCSSGAWSSSNSQHLWLDIAAGRLNLSARGLEVASGPAAHASPACCRRSQRSRKHGSSTAAGNLHRDGDRRPRCGVSGTQPQRGARNTPAAARRGACTRSRRGAPLEGALPLRDA